MPLVRAEVRNEYALGAPELYREAKKEEPKEILEGVAVAGLVGVLRQLGDLAEFAAEVFHGLQEEVTITTARSHKLMARVRRIESALSPLEKASLAQRSHLHFAYTAGSNWHTRIRCEQNHFIYSDVPQFIMESYEDSRHPPCLHMLDRFDTGGPGSCLKRYSDPTFFKRSSVVSGEATVDKIPKDKKGRKTKKRRSRHRNGEMSRDLPFSFNSGRMPFTEQSISGYISPSQTASTYDTTFRSDLGEQSNLDLKNGSVYIEGDFRPSYSVEPESRDSISSAVNRHENDFLDYNFLEEKAADVYNAIEVVRQEQARCSSSSVTWEEKRESFEPTSDGMAQEYSQDRHLESFALKLEMETLGDEGPDFKIVDQLDDRQSCNEIVPESESGDLQDVQYCSGAVPEPESSDVHLDDMESETDNFMDALNTIESECESDIDITKKQVVEPREGDGECELGRYDLECQSASPECSVIPSSPLINGSYSPLINGTYSPHGHGLVSMTQKSSATDFNNDAPPGDGHISVPLRDKDLQSSQSTKDSASPDCRKRSDSKKHGMPKLKRHNLECQSSTPESSAVANSPLTNGSYEHTLIPTPPKSLYVTDCFTSESSQENDVNSTSLLKKSLQSSQRTGDTVSSRHPKCRDSQENGKNDAGSHVESVSSTASSNLGDVRPESGKSPESQRHLPEISNVTPVSFWTNGGLLGLQPSKPPDFSIGNALPQDPDYKKDGKSNSSVQQNILSDKDSGKSDHIETSRSIEEDPDMDNSSHEYQEAAATFRKASWKISPADLEINLGKLGDSLYRSNANSTRSSVTTPESFMVANSDHQENSTSSSRMFGLSNRMLSTGSNEKSLLGGNGGYQNGSIEYHASSGRSKDLLGGKSPVLSPSSSPPLEHMRISFQPINGFDSSKMKLKFPDGKTNNGNSGDIYPSFQLVPEVSIPRYNIGSDSDAETFYRSSPSLSDDCHSNQSESNSEQWESSESPTSKDRDLYDALRRISLKESVPENVKAEQEHMHGNSGNQYPFAENGVQRSESCRSFDLQSLSTINNSFRKELRIDTDSKDLVEPHLSFSSALPPLPPFEWRGTMLINEKSETIPEGSYYAHDLARSASAVSQPKPAPLNEDQIDTTNMQKSKLNSRKSNGKRDESQIKTTDENDFLHQIRTKSFNLRPTMIARPTVPSGAPGIVHVNAILEKANAIRQAVASDADDDGNWSDT